MRCWSRSPCFLHSADAAPSPPGWAWGSPGQENPGHQKPHTLLTHPATEIRHPVHY
ncbi:hypothetical protein DPMN_054380 [Dreissena polymorpha]|uniref:Uncharacterized protein n=1 Tax=Dreissena polymorpha TaxID=45954 RepID=A0A9D4HR61_DREPO|nr:hypothetical protein DPMN_054380 [Dreissena polymorpha]